jgi:3-carboxy-cis,cis-muconate cycloisomerase
MVQEHERALGAWQAEQAEWSSLWMSAHGSLRALATALPGLRVDAARMQANIDHVRAGLPHETVQEWFAPTLVEMASAQARQRVAELRRVAA